MMKYNIFFLLIIQSLLSFAQKSLTLPEAEQLMQKNNLLLLAEQYNISASQAAVIQAKIWDQPYLSGELNAVNPQNNKMFDLGGNGQKALSVQQLIYLGGKKKNEVNFAKSNVTKAELQFEQLLRNLKYQLAQTFYTIYYDNQEVSTIEIQVNKLDTLLSNYQIQAIKGNIPLKEVVRLQSLVLNLKNDKNERVKDIIEAQETLSLLTGISEAITPEANEIEFLSKNQKSTITKDTILSIALKNNLDYLTAVKVSESQELFLKWQKSLSVPDLTAGTSYDQRGGAFQNQINITFGMPLPLWNRNKGNIKMAEAQLKQTNFSKDYKKLELEEKVETYWQIWLQQQSQFNSINRSVIDNLQSVYNGMVNNFKQRNVSLLEFTDFMESYNQTTIQINEIKKYWILSSININYITNKEIF